MVTTEYPGVESASKWLFDRFDVEYIVNPDQTCCTGLGYYSDLLPFSTTLGVAARNACVAVDAEHPIQSYLCSTCYAINKKSRNVLEVPEFRKQTNKALAKIGREYTDAVAGEIKLMMGIDAAGKLLGVRVLAHKETPGLGDKIEVKKGDWILRFTGLSLGNPPAARWKVKKDGGEFDQFAGATITPRGVVRAIHGGLKFFAAHKAELLEVKTNGQ